MTPEESTEELSDFELTQRLRAARGQEPLPDPNSIEAQLRAGAAKMIEDHRNHGLVDHRMRGIDYSRVVIDDPIAAPLPLPYGGTPIGTPLPRIGIDPGPDPGIYEWKMPRGLPAIDYLHTVKPVAYPSVTIPLGDYIKPIPYKGGTIKIGDGPTIPIGDLDITVPDNGTDLRFDNTSDNAIALAAGPPSSGTVTGRLKWTGRR